VEKDLTDFGEQLKHAVGREATAEALAQVVTLRALEHLIGPVGGRNILNLACGDGTLSRWLAAHGAKVTGVDISAEAIDSAKHRETGENHGISYFVGDAEDLYMIDDSAFDDVICHLSLDKFENLGSIVAEVSRIIRLGGRFIFSVDHPCFQLRTLTTTEQIPDENNHNYFAEKVTQGENGELRHRPLAAYINAVAARGFTVRRLIEPAADERDVEDKPEFEDWKKSPVALVVEAVFPHL
jgi:SAM-dependent methyltransferase